MVIILFSCSESPQEHAQKAGSLFEEGDTNKGIAELTLAIEKEEDQKKKLTYYTLRAEAYLKNNQLEKAVKDYNILAQKDDLLGPSYYFNEIANWYTEVDSLNLAIHYYTLALNSDPNDNVVLYNLGSTWFDLEEYEKCIEALTTSINLGMKDSLILLYRANAYTATNRFSEALKDYYLHESMFGQDSYTQHGIGQCYSYLEKYDSAIVFYNSALQFVKADSLEILSDRSMSHFYLENYKECLSDLQLAYAIDSTDAQVNYQLAFLHFETSKFEEALNYYSRSIRFGDSSATNFIERGETYRELGKPDQACKDFLYANSIGSEEASELLGKHCE